MYIYSNITKISAPVHWDQVLKKSLQLNQLTYQQNKYEGRSEVVL